MSEFVASNGGSVWSVETTGDGSRLLVKSLRAYNRKPGGPSTAHLIDEQVQALREFFQHERDEQLGRWRDPQRPDCVVYPFEDGNAVRVIKESPMTFESDFSRDYATEHPIVEAVYPVEILALAATHYFAAHPLVEPKPWHDATPGEVWVLTDHLDRTHAVSVRKVNDHLEFESVASLTRWDIDAPAFIAGRRLWPEVTE